MDGSRFFFAAEVLSVDEGTLEVAMPPAIHEAERRSLPRHQAAPASVVVESAGQRWSGRLLDRSYEGAAIGLERESPLSVGSKVALSFDSAADCDRPYYGLVRNTELSPGWRRIGLSVSAVPFGPQIAVDSRRRILAAPPTKRAQRELRFLSSTLGAAADRLQRALGVDVGAAKVEVHRYRNNLEQEMVAIADRVGSGRDGLVVVVAPAWGRTKETMLPLAMVLAETFAAGGKPVSILRFDGTNRRGESWIEPEFRSSGSEYLGFRFSQAVEDIHATIRFVSESEDFRAKEIVLVTASLASVEGRRAVATDPTRLIKGWVSLVGMVDLHSGLRAASGGVDYAYGLEKGVRFGRHEVAGVLADMDLTGWDVLNHHLGLFEDARRDMSAIEVPVSWIHGRHDGWIELDRVRDLLSAGSVENRRLIEVPTGHQLRSSRQALETFQLVAEEVSQIAFGQRLEPAVPRGRLLAAKQVAERARRPAAAVDLQEFWRQYVLGRPGGLGFEILAATSAYRNLMDEQVSLLRPESGQTIADLGAGVGDFIVALERRGSLPGRVIALDFLSDALRRSLDRRAGSLMIRPVVANLDNGRIPLASESMDGVLASLVVSYVSRPDRFLREVRRVLKPGGRFVVSSPRKDADLSRIYVDGIRELDPATVRARFGAEVERRFSELQRDLLNQGARLLALEDEGWFQFWDREELAELVEDAGFVQVTSSYAFGNPPQVAVVSGRRS
jgi:ubiquinone/menaquinone biosynthesis C-methylase UbiE